MATAGSIVVDLLMRTGSFETDTARAEKRLKQLQKQIDDTAKTIGTALGAGVATAVTALTALTVQSINYADQLDEISARLGISTEVLSAWGYAADRSGTSLEALTSALPKLSKNLATALDEGSKQAELFDALGISVTDAAGKLRDVEEVLPEIADKFKGLDDDTTEAALAMELFGKSGAELLEFLNRGSSGLDDFAAKAQALGIIVGEDTAQNAALFKDELDDLQTLTTSLGLQIADKLLPSMIKLVEGFSDLVRNGQAAEKIVSAIEFVLDDLTTGFDQMNHVIQTATDLFGGLYEIVASDLQILGNLATFDWEGVGDAIDRGLSGVDRFKKGFQTFDEFQANKNRQQPGQMPSYLEGPSYLTGQAPFSAIGAPALTPTGGVPVDAAKVTNFFKNTTEDKKKAAKATKELTEFEKDLIEIEKIWADAAADVVVAQGEKIKALEDARAAIDGQISDMEFELALVGKGNRERAIEVELRYAGAAATEEQRKQIAELAGATYDANVATDRQIEAMDGLRESTRGFLTDLKEGKGIWDSLSDAADNFADILFDIAARGVIDQIFGQRGDTAGGATGSFFSSIFAAFAGAKATGGDVFGDRAYLVGEQGPEMFVPRTAGTIVPADETSRAFGGGGGGLTQVNNFNYQAPYDARTEEQKSAQLGFVTRDALRSIGA